MSRFEEPAGHTADSGLWDRLAELTQSMTVPAGPIERLLALHTIEQSGWDLIVGRVVGGVLTEAEAYQTFACLVSVIRSTDWADLPAVFRTRSPPDGRQPVPARVRRYLDAHATHGITLHGVARAVGVSVRGMTRDFRRCYGLSVHDYLTRSRVSRAARLLVETETKVQAIAMLVGFGHERALCRHVARLLGSTPGAIRAHRDHAAAARALIARQRRPGKRA